MMTASWNATIPMDRQRELAVEEDACIRSSWRQVGGFGSRSAWGLRRTPLGYVIRSSVISPLSPNRVSPDSCFSPPSGAVSPNRSVRVPSEKEIDMKIARRIAIALSSLLAVALAGGAHWRG
jgi:hypothetical protein